MNEEQKTEFNEWWQERIEFLARLPGESEEERVRRIAFRAYEAALEHNDLD